MERTFRESIEKPSEITEKPAEEIIQDQLDIKLGHSTEGEFDIVPKTIKITKLEGLDEIPAEIWKTRKFVDILL